MNLLTKGKIISYLAAIFVAGGISGGVIAWKEAKQEMFKPPSSKKMCAFFRERLQAELKLSPLRCSALNHSWKSASWRWKPFIPERSSKSMNCFASPMNKSPARSN